MNHGPYTCFTCSLGTTELLPYPLFSYLVFWVSFICLRAGNTQAGFRIHEPFLNIINAGFLYFLCGSEELWRDVQWITLAFLADSVLAFFSPCGT